MASLRLQPAQPVNAHFFGYNLETYATSGVELAFNDTAGLALARALHLGALRYPGGTVSNIWDVRDGRFVQPPAPIGKTYERVWLPFFPKVAAFAAGTFSGASFLGGLGGEARRALWCLNVFSANASESCEQARRPFAAPPSPELKVPPPDPAFASAAPPHLAAPRGPHHQTTTSPRLDAPARPRARRSVTSASCRASRPTACSSSWGTSSTSRARACRAFAPRRSTPRRCGPLWPARVD